MQSQQKPKQPTTLSSLYQLLQLYFGPSSESSKVPQIKIQTIDDAIKKLQPIIYEAYTKTKIADGGEENSLETQQEQVGKFSKQEMQLLTKDQECILRMVDLLVVQALATGNLQCVDWLISVVKITATASAVKQQSIYQLTKQSQQTGIIALPCSQPQQTSNTAIVLASDCAQQQQQSVSSAQSAQYFNEDQLLISEYLSNKFYVVKRKAVAKFSLLVVYQLCHTFISNFFVKNPSAYDLDMYLKFIELLVHIQAPIYTYYLLSCFKEYIEKLCICLKEWKISKSVSSEKVNKLIYSLSSVSNRWQNSVYYNKQWEWQLKSNLILALLKSNVSQTKLTAVKMLVQLCKRVQYSTYTWADLRKFIAQNEVLNTVFTIDNHPEIISKGKQIYQFLCKYETLSQAQLSVLLDLLRKTNQSTRKHLYQIIQSLGQANLTHYCNKILQTLQNLPRPQYYTDETVDLLETMLVIAPSQSINQNIMIIWHILKKHYQGFRKGLRERLGRLFFQGFIIGLEELLEKEKKEQQIREINKQIQHMESGQKQKQSQQVNIAQIAQSQKTSEKQKSKQQQKMEQNKIQEQSKNEIFNIIQPISESLGTNLFAFMLDSFIRVVKSQIGKPISYKIKQILKKSIQNLFKIFQIHKLSIPEIQLEGEKKITRSNYREYLMANPSFYSKYLHHELLKHLLESYEGKELPLTYEQLSALIRENISFTKFIQYYPAEKQLQVISELLTSPNKDNEHLNNIVHMFSMIGHSDRQELLTKIQQWMLDSESETEKSRLADFLAEHTPNPLQKLKNLLPQMTHNPHQNTSPSSPCSPTHLLGKLILLKQLLKKSDKKGYSNYLPFSFSSNSHTVTVSVTNSIDVLKPYTYEMCVQSYETLSEVVSKILVKDLLKICNVNFMVNQKYIGVGELDAQIWEFEKKILVNNKNKTNLDAIKAQYRYTVNITIMDVYEREWFDKSQLINHGILNPQVILALTEVFTKYTTSGRMHRYDCARLFELATEIQKISVNDNRIEHLYTHYSENGEYLIIDEWLNFYQKSAEDNPAVVIDNLKKLGYKHLFKSQAEILEEYSGHGENQIRRYLCQSKEEEAQLLHQVCLREHNSHKIIKFCRGFLQLLPIQSSLLIQTNNQLKQEMVEQAQQADKKEKIKNSRIDYKQVCNRLVGMKLRKSNQLWYILALLSQSFNKQEQAIQLSVAQRINEKLVSILEELLRTPEDSQDVEVMLSLTNLVRNYFGKNSETSLLPSTFLDDRKFSQNYIQSEELIQQPLGKMSSIILPDKGSPQVLYKRIKKVMQVFLASQSPQQTQHLQMKLLDNLFILSLFNMQSLIQQIEIEEQYIFHRSRDVRILINNYYFFLSDKCPQIRKFYFGVDTTNFANTFRNSAGKTEDRFDQFYRTLNKMMRLESSENQSQVYAKISKNIQDSIRLLVSQQQSVQPQLGTIDESVGWTALLTHNISLLNSLILYKPDIEIPHPEEWLSALLRQNYNNQTRCLLYRLAQSLSPLDYNLNLLLDIMKDVRIDKNSQVRKHQRMGLHNLGCICYLNSTVQQLFMVQPFRNAIIQIQLPSEEEHSNIDSMQEKAPIQPYFQQFQYMMYQLMFGQRQFFIPDKFCLTYTDFQNKPIDIKQQHDADEFLNSLFDRLERTFSQLPSVYVDPVATLFRGELANIITCQSCFSSRFKSEPFNILTLQIKHSKTLLQCFEKLIEPQNISDYYCEICDRKVELISKQIKLKKLPQFLFIHLQRLVFDLQSLSKIKLEHLIEYPQVLQLGSYCYRPEDAMEDTNSYENQSVKYRLKGFIVHVGTSESGHYYSLVKEGDNWVKFDDSRVEGWKWSNYSREKEGTYMLIYQKIVGNKTQLQQSKPQKTGNKDLLKKVKIDNKTLQRQRLFLQECFSQTVTQILSLIKIPLQLVNPESPSFSSPNKLEIPYNPSFSEYLTQGNKQAYEKAHDIILMYLRLAMEGRAMSFYQFNADHFRGATCYFVMILHVCPTLANRTADCLLNTEGNTKINTNYLRLVLSNSQKIIRQCYKLILVKLLSILNFQNRNFDCYTLAISKQISSPYFYSQKIVEYLLGALFDAAKNYSKMEEYFEFLLLSMQVSGKIVQYYDANLLGAKLVHFVCGDQTLMKGILQPYGYQNPKKSDAFATIAQILSKLIEVYCRKVMQGMRQGQEQYFKIHYTAYYKTKWATKFYDSRHPYEYVNQCLFNLCSLGSVEDTENSNVVLLEHAQYSSQLTNNLINLVLQKMNRFSSHDQYILAYAQLFGFILRIASIQVSNSKHILQSVLGIPRLFLTPNQAITSQCRHYKYWSNSLTQSDEVILPVLQLLYTNRYHPSYLMLATTTILLQHILFNKCVSEYIARLPAPIQCERYLDWLSGFINCCLKDKDKGEGDQANQHKWREWVNQIARLLSQLQASIWEQNPKEISKMQQPKCMQQEGEQKQQEIMRSESQRVEKQPFRKQNQINQYYRLRGLMQIQQEQQVNKQGSYSMKIIVMKDEDNKKAVKYHIKVDKNIKKYTVQFLSPNYEYCLYCSSNEVEIDIPYPQPPYTVTSTLSLTPLELRQAASSEQVACSQQPVSSADNAISAPADDTKQQQQKDNGHTNTDIRDQASEQVYECPFCTSISFTWSSRCAVCGEEWGEMM